MEVDRSSGASPPLALLRDWRPDDAARLLELACASHDLRNQFGDRQLTTVEACEQIIRSAYAPGQATQRHFAIEVNGGLVGNIGVSHINPHHETAWVSYWVGIEARGHHLATRGLISVCEWAFREGRLFRLELGHRVNNAASCAVARRAGFMAEGVERAKLKYGNERFDVELHARLATDPPPNQTGLENLAYRT